LAAGDDTLRAGRPNVLIGGSGLDGLIGGPNDDVLIGEHDVDRDDGRWRIWRRPGQAMIPIRIESGRRRFLDVVDDDNQTNSPAAQGKTCSMMA
jgi:hypothetical protein